MLLPTEIGSRFRLFEGATLFLAEDPGGFQICDEDAEFKTPMDAAGKVLKKHRAVLRNLTG